MLGWAQLQAAFDVFILHNPSVKNLFDVIVNCFSNSVEQHPTKFKQVSGEVKFHWSERRGGA